MAVKTRAQIQAQSNTTYIDNTVGAITPNSVRSLNNNWTDSTLFFSDTGSLTVASASVAVSSSFAATASFFSGSISNAINAISASYAVNASTANTASFVLSASFASNANSSLSSSFASASISSSFASSATSSSFAQSSISSSFASNSTSASYSISSSFATSASFAINSSTASSAEQFNVRLSLTASGIRYPLTDGLEGQVIKTDGTNDLSFGDVNTIFEDVFAGENLTKGDPLYISGSQGATPKVFKADAGVASKMPVTYIAAETVALGNATRGIVLGQITGINLTGYAPGTEIYVAVGGGWTSTRPTGSAIVQLLGLVTKEGSGGQGLILNPGPANLPNLNSGSIWIGNTNSIPTQVLTSSIQNVVSSSYAGFAETIASGLSITASSLQVINNITASSISAQSASFGYVTTITGSAIIVGQQYIILNTQTPASRYAGLVIYDSGSNDTASIVWDSQTNHFVYQNVAGETYSGGGFISGPKNSGSLSDVSYPTQNRILRSQGEDHIYDSNIIDNDTTVKIGINTEITGSLIVSAGITGNLTGTASFANSATSSSFASSATSASFANNSTSASFASSAISSSFAQSSISSSFAESSISSSFASSAISANTASYVLNAVSSSFATNALTASFLLGTIATASFAQNANTASYVLNAVSASFSTNSLTASLANRIGILSQSVVITGSVQGNVVSASIASSTASLDFNLGNFFTSAVSGTTFFNVTNVKPGQTVNVLLDTVAIATASFSSNVKQPSGSAYTPSSGSGNKDVLTFASWDASNVYLVNVKKLI